MINIIIELFRKLVKKPRNIFKVFGVSKAILLNFKTALYHDIMALTIQDSAYKTMELKHKIYTIYYLGNYLRNANKYLYTKLNSSDKDIFVRWLIKRYGGG